MFEIIEYHGLHCLFLDGRYIASSANLTLLQGIARYWGKPGAVAL